MSRKMFYRECYLKTGWLPMNPLARHLSLGDVCQIRQGRFLPLLNLRHAHLVERVAASAPVAFDPVDWKLSLGVQQTFCETHWSEDEEGARNASTRQVLAFAQAGAFQFHAAAVNAHLLTNWDEIRDDVTLKLTQLHYGFREVYVVTEIAIADDWGLVIADQAGARLEMSAALGSSDSYALLSHASARAEQCHGIAVLERPPGQPGFFFRARKLVMSDAAHDHYLNQMLDNPSHLRPSDLANWFNTPLYNLVRTNELNLNSSIGFFSWTGLTLDDVELLAA